MITLITIILAHISEIYECDIMIIWTKLIMKID